jgi:hypothetical protein
MKNHCAYCHGKFGLVRHRRAFKSFCSQPCVEHYQAWLRAQAGKRKGWSDCLWSDCLWSASFVPGATRAVSYLFCFLSIFLRLEWR